MAPLARPITTAAHAIDREPLNLLDPETDQGVPGRAYLLGYTPLVLRPLVDLIDEVAATLTGQEVASLARMPEMVRAFACWAVRGWSPWCWQASIWCFGMPAPVPAYESHGFVDPARDEADIAASLQAGFDALKVKIGAPTVAEDIAILRRMRKMIGSDRCLMMDHHQAFSAPQAIRRVHAIEDTGIDLDWIEEPVAAEDYAGHIDVRQAVATPLQTGENWWTADDAARAVGAGICDHAMPDMMKIGGITGWQKAAALIAGAGIPASGHLFIEASSHMLAVTPRAYLLEYLDVAGAVLQEPYVIENGALVPGGPGLGLD